MGSVSFPETGKRLGGPFLEYWRKNGGLMQQGFPIFDEFQERSDLDGKTYTVQYFERAVFELHPENPAPNEVLLSQLGIFQLKRKYPNGVAAPPPLTPTPDAFGELRRRPLQLPTVSPGGACPASQGRRQVMPNGDILAFGSGPVFLNGSAYFTPNGIMDLSRVPFREGAFRYEAKAPWSSKPEYSYPFLVRGMSLEGTGRVRFDYDQNLRPQEEGRFDKVNDHGSGDWGFWPAVLVLPGPGCFGLQVDGRTFTDMIIFQAVDGPR